MILDFRGGDTTVNPSPPEFNFDAPGSIESRINYNSGKTLLTRVQAGEPFLVKATRAIDVQAREAATAKSNFPNSLDVGLEAVPQPASLVLVASAAAALALTRRLRKR